MADKALHYRRKHHLLLLHRLLALRESPLPFTLILDSLEQSAKPLIAQYVHCAKKEKTIVVFLSYETLKPFSDVDVVINARRKDAVTIQMEARASSQINRKRIFIIDTIHPLISDPSLNLSAFLSSFMSPHTSIVATYHLDVPVHSPITSSYLPSSLTLLKYLATTIFTTHSASQVFARKRSMSKSLAEPVFGLMEATEGVLVGMGSNDPQGVVLEMEHRRRSGRGVEEWFFMSAVTDVASLDDQMQKPIILLDDHPLCCAQPVDDSTTADGFEESTFSLQLTEKQRRDRERVILPYFDAQREGGGVGGRILYDMDAEDDFDEEEDEI